MRVTVSHTARRDIQQTLVYYRAPSQMGDEFDALFHEAVEHLRQWPYTGHRRRDLTTADVCFWFEDPYFFVFRVVSEELSLAAILHSSRNVAEILRHRFRN